MGCKNCIKLRQEIKMLNSFIELAQPEEWDMQGIYEDVLYGRFNGNKIEGMRPNKKFAEWIATKFALEVKEVN